MSNKDQPNRGIIDGMLGGLIVSLLNPIFQSNKEKTDYDDWDKKFEKKFFDSFSDQVDKKRDGYKLKYDINESKIRSKYLNLVPVNEYIDSIEINYEENKSAAEYLVLEESWKTRKMQIDNMVKDNKFKSLISVNTVKAKYWIYSIKESKDYMKIIITNREEGKFTQEEKVLLENTHIYDDYICLEISEAQELAKEMKKYYHNYVERVVMVEDLKIDSYINESEYRDDLVKLIPDYFEILEIIKQINEPKYIEIGRFFDRVSLERHLYVLLNCFNLAIQLYEDKYYKDSIMVFKSLLNSDKILLKKNNLENEIYQQLMYIYIDLKSEKEIIDLIKNKYNKDYYYMRNLSKELYNLKLYKAANTAYSIIIKNEDSIGLSFDVFEAYIRTEDDEGMKAWREKLIKQGEKTFLIDRYLNDENIEGLEIKIARCEKNEDWSQVINYCNKYNRLILLHPWKTMEDRVDYEFKKLEAYIKLKKYNHAWNSACKTRMILISNFKGINYFKYLSKIEWYMSDISLKSNYLIDTFYHYIMKKVYKDMFLFYEDLDKASLDWNKDLYLQDLIGKNKFEKAWYKIEEVLKYEYANVSKSTVRNISHQINNILEKENIQLILKEPKKYFPNKIFRDFHINLEYY